MGVDAGSVYSSIRIRLTDLDNDLKGVYARLNQLESNITKTTESSKKNTNAFSKSWNDLTKSFISGQLAVDAIKKGFSLLTGAIKDSIKVSVESQEIISKYGVVFEGMGSDAEVAAKTFSKSFDLAGSTAKEMLSNTGNLLQGLGATKEESLQLSLQVNTLASDLASFTNNAGGSKAASEALTKALLGERESAKTLGIAILESDVVMRVARNGQDKLTGTALKMARAQATVQLITEQAKNSIGDYARTADSAANSQKRAEESTKKLQEAVGGALNPVIILSSNIWSKISNSLSEVITKSNDLRDADDATKKGNATYEQRILLLEEEKKAIENKILLNDQSWSSTPAEEKRIADEKKRYEEEIKNVERRISGINRAKQTQELADRTKKKSDEEAAKAANDLMDSQEKKAIADAKQIEERKNAESEYNKQIAFTKFQLDNNLISQEESYKSNLGSANAYINKLYELGYAQDNEIGTIGRQALDELIAKYPELISLTKEATEATNNFGIGFEDLAEQEKKMAEISVAMFSGAAAAATEAMFQGEDAWTAMAKSGLNSIAALLDAIAIEIDALAVKEILLYGLFNPAGWIAAAPFIAKGVAVSASAGAVRGMAGSFATGGIVPGNSFSGDNMIANVNSGEMILNGGQQKALFDMLSGIASNNGNINASSTPIYLDGKMIGEMVTRYQRTKNR